MTAAMKKIVRILSSILIIAAALFLLHFILTLDGVDAWLTGKILKNESNAQALIYTEWAEECYETEDADKPCIYARDGRLYMAVGTNVSDITPAGINISYYGGFIDFNEMIRYKKNCIVSRDGRYIVYRLEFNEIPYLYYFDTALQKAFFVSDRVDSFDLLENDGTEALTLIYATGYSQANKLFFYRSDPTGKTAGANGLISENNKISGIFEAYGSILYLDLSGTLFRYEPASGKAQKIAAEVDDIYFPGEERYNYDDYYDDFTVCCRKNGKDYIVNGSAEAAVEEGYYNVLPKYTFTDGSGGKYYYSLKNKRIIRTSGGTETILYQDLGDLYHVFAYVPDTDQKGTGAFLAASEDTLYLLQSDGSASSELMPLPGRYRGRTNLLEDHMEVYAARNDVYYVSLLTSGSIVLNPKNAGSWLNGINSYNYGLTAIRKEGQSYAAQPLSVPPSRRMSSPVPVSISENAGKMTYISYFADGRIKSVSLLSAQGGLLHADLLGTSVYAEEQCGLEVYPCFQGTYLLRERKDGTRDFFLLSEDSAQLDPVMDEKGILTENYKDFTAAVSFGKLVIF